VLTPLSISQPKPATLSGVMNNLTWPFMAIYMKNQDAEDDSQEELFQKTPFLAIMMQITPNIVQHTHGRVTWDMFEEPLE
jgi:hypothetical protein